MGERSGGVGERGLRLKYNKLNDMGYTMGSLYYFRMSHGVAAYDDIMRS